MRWALETAPVILTSWDSPFQLEDLSLGASKVAALRTDHDPVFDLGDAGRRPGDAFGFLAFDPGANSAFQYHLTAVGFDGDTIGVDLGVSLERFHNLVLKLRGLHLGLHRDDVGHALDALHLAHGVFSGGFLILPLHRAFQSYPAILDDDFDPVMGDRQFGLQGRHRVARNVRIGALIDRRQPDL